MDNNYGLPEIKKIIMGTNPELYKQGKNILAIEKILIFPKQAQPIIVDLVNCTDQEKAQKLSDIDKTLKQSNSKLADGINYYTNSNKFIHYYSKALKAQNEKNNNALRAALIAAGITLGAAGLGGLGYGIYHHLNNNVAEVNDELAAVPDISEQDWEYYLEKALDNSQKDLFQSRIMNWLAVNGKEDWQKVTLTDEEKESFGYESENCLYGFTASEAYALALRFGNYSNSEYTTITGGKAIDVVNVMDDTHSMSNGALSSVIAYYINSDKCDLQIEKLINFNDQEVAKIKEIEKLFQEFKELEKDEEKVSEAEDKMHEIKAWLNEYAYNVDYEQDNAKSYILRTFVPAASIISQLHQYKDTISISLYDKETQNYVDKEIQTELFDEIMMRNLVLGYVNNSDNGMFDSEHYLEEHGISSDRYQLMMTDVVESIADQSCSSQSQKLEQANEYMTRLSHENAIAESAFGTSNGDTIDLANSNHVITDWDKLVHGTYDPEILIEKLNEYLVKNELYPENRIYFSTKKISKEQEEYKDTHGITAGEVGDYIETETQQEVPVTANDLQQENVIVVNDQQEVIPPEQAMEEARQENVEQTGIPDASTPEASEKVEEQIKQSDDFQNMFDMLQGVYNATFNHIVGGPVVKDGIDTSNTYGQVYTDDWAHSSDPNIVFNYNMAVQDANNYINTLNQDGTIIEGEIEIQPEFQEAETYSSEQAPVESEDHRTTNNSETVEDSTIETETNSDATEMESTTQEVFDGITNEEPTGFAPAVDSDNISSSEVDNTVIYNLENMTDEELESFLASLNDVELETEQAKTK